MKKNNKFIKIMKKKLVLFFLFWIFLLNVNELSFRALNDINEKRINNHDNNQAIIERNKYKGFIEQNIKLPQDLIDKKDIIIDSIINEIYLASEEYNISKEYLFIIAFIESNFNPKAKGKTHDYGLFQLTRYAVKEYEKVFKVNIKTNQLYNIHINTKIAAWFLKQKLQESLNIEEAVAKYNAGNNWESLGKKYVEKFKNGKIILKNIKEELYD